MVLWIRYYCYVGISLISFDNLIAWCKVKGMLCKFDLLLSIKFHEVDRKEGKKDIYKSNVCLFLRLILRFQ